MVIAIAKDPRLTDRAARQRCGEQVGQTPSAPEPILINRFESKRIQKHVTHGMSFSLSSIAGASLSPCLVSQISDCDGEVFPSVQYGTFRLTKMCPTLRYDYGVWCWLHCD